MAQERPTPSLEQDRRLADTLVVLAGTPDDQSGVDDLLIAVAQLTAQRVAAVSYASVTARCAGSYSTVAASNDIAVAVDQAQYADGAGPCLEALDSARPLSVPEIAVTMRWPGFRDAATRLGLHSSLSIPLFAGRREPVAALNLYGHDATAMTALSSAVLAAYDETAPAGLSPEELGPGATELVEGLIEAFEVWATVQQAVGVILARQSSTPDRAYAALRLRAADAGVPLLATATAILAGERT